MNCVSYNLSRNRMFNERQEVQAPGFSWRTGDETGKPLRGKV